MNISSSRVVEREREILTIIMLTPTRWIGLGYGFEVEQFSLTNSKSKNLQQLTSKSINVKLTQQYDT